MMDWQFQNRQDFIVQLKNNFISPFNSQCEELKKRIDFDVKDLGQNLGTGIINKEGRVLKDSQAHILVLHGLGSEHSNIKSTLHYLSVFNERGQGRKKSGKPPSTRHFLQSNFSFEISAEAISLPGTPGGSSIDEVTSTIHFNQWLKHVVNNIHSDPQDKPLFILCRSASAMLALEAAHRMHKKGHGKAIAGIIMISPMYPYNPEHPEWLSYSKKELIHFAKENQIKYDQKMIDWMYERHREIELTPQLLNSVPTLVLVGENDRQQVPPHERQKYQSLSETFEFFEYHEIKGGEHDLLTPNRRLYKQRIASLNHIFRFVEKHS